MALPTYALLIYELHGMYMATSQKLQRMCWANVFWKYVGLITYFIKFLYVSTCLLEKIYCGISADTILLKCNNTF